MSPAPELRVGVVGYGVMGKAHCYAYRVAPMLRRLPVTPVVSVISGRNEAAVAAAAVAYGVPEHTTDWRALVGRDDIDIVDICTPPGTHAEIAAAAAAAGKAVLCEKPLAVSYPQAAAALAAVTSAGVHHAVSFNYRRLPALALMRQMIADGVIGEVRLWRATWLSDEFTDPATPHDWRFDARLGGTTIADLGSHLIDLAHLQVGGIRTLCAQVETFIKERPAPGGGTRAVTVDDAASALLRFDSGAIGTMEVARATSRSRPTAATARWSSTTRASTSCATAALATTSTCMACGEFGPNTPATRTPPTGGRSGKASGTGPVSSTRSLTCSRAGRRRRGSPASAKGPRRRRCVRPSKPPRRRAGGSRSPR